MNLVFDPAHSIVLADEKVPEASLSTATAPFGAAGEPVQSVTVAVHVDMPGSVSAVGTQASAVVVGSPSSSAPMSVVVSIVRSCPSMSALPFETSLFPALTVGESGA